MPDQNWFFLIPLLFIIAFMYSSVGHGGASGYLALMAIFNFPHEQMKSTALLLNVLVSFVSFWHFYRAGYFNRKLFTPFALTSIPAAFIGGYLTLDPFVYKKILGFLLLFPILRLFGFFGHDSDQLKPVHNFFSLLIGAGIGFLSGLIGIGGGIILSPIILLLHWGRMKEVAAASALFIFVNSLSGLTGQIISGIQFHSSMFILLSVALIGGIAGSYYGVNKFNALMLRRVLALVLLIASVKLLSL